MSILSEIERLRENVNNSLAAVRNKGVEIPTNSKSDNLPELIEKISGGTPFEMTDDGDGNITINSTVFTAHDDGDGNITFIPTSMLIQSEEDGNVVLV